MRLAPFLHSLFLFQSCSLFAATPLQEFLTGRVTSFKSIPIEKGFKECYEVFVRQLVDVKNPEKGFFQQKLYVSHIDAKKPLILFISGYGANKNTIKDWSTHLSGNQIFVEHRYFGSSKPDSIDYETLSIENAAFDLHRIRELFGEFYSGSWIATGGSKGGLTAAIYKYLFPNDVKITILHSTSIKDKDCDTSFFDYIDSLSQKYGCLDKITYFQRKVLEQRDSILPKLKKYLDAQKSSYDKLTLDLILEMAVLEFPFSLWQNNQGCRSITDIKDSPDSLFAELEKGVDGWFLSDPGEEIDPFAYQAYKELGYYCYKTEKVLDLLKAAPKNPASHLRPPIAIEYSNELMKKLKIWLTERGNNIIYLNGDFDPYSRYLIVPSINTNAVLYKLKEKNHLQVGYGNLTKKEQNEIDKLITSWLSD